MGSASSAQRSPVPVIEALHSDHRSYISLLSPDVFKLLVPFFFAANGIPRLGFARYYPADDQECGPDPSIFTLVPGTRRISSGAIDKLCIASPADPVLRAMYTSPRQFGVFTRRGVITAEGYYSWREICTQELVWKKWKVRLGRILSFYREALSSPEWNDFAQELHRYLVSVSPRSISMLPSLGTRKQWVKNTQELATRLATADSTPDGLRRGIVQLARDLESRPIYPAVSAAILSTALGACKLPTDCGAILLQHLTDHKGFRQVEIVITDYAVVWARSSSNGRSSSQITSTLPFEVLGARSITASRRKYSSGHADFKCSDSQSGSEYVIGAPHLVPGFGSRNVFVFLVALRHLLLARSDRDRANLSPSVNL